MAIISFDRDTVVDYIPEYAGNRESLDPCIVRLKFVPYSRVQHYARLITAKTRGQSDSVRVAEVAHEVQKKQFVENVDSISGYYVGEMEVGTPAEFYDTADTDLVIEIVKAMESHAKLTEGQVKN